MVPSLFSPVKDEPVPRRFIVLVVVGILATAVLAVLVHRNQSEYFRADTSKTLTAIARLKANQVVAWRKDRLADGDRLTGSITTGSAVAAYLSDPHETTPEVVVEQMGLLVDRGRYSTAWIVDTSGGTRLVVADGQAELHEMTRAALSEALNDGEPRLTDLHETRAGGGPHVDLICPLYAEAEEAAKPIGAIVLSTSAEEFLFPLISEWPLPSESGESMLVRPEGDSVLVLNDTRFAPDAALELSIPLVEEERLAVRAAALGRPGILEGIDYRGHPAIAAAVPVNDTPWVLIAKLDAKEANRALADRVTLIWLSFAAITLGTVGTAGLIWNHKASVLYRQRYDAEHERARAATRLAESQALLRDILDTAPIRVFWKNLDLRYLGCNAAFARDAGLDSTDDIIGMSDHELVWAAQAHDYREDDRTVIETGTAKLGYEEPQTTQTGDIRWLRTSLVPMRDGNGAVIGVLGTYEDVTPAKLAEQELRRSEERYQLLFEHMPVGFARIRYAADGGVSEHALIDEVNDAFIEMVGVSREDAAGTRLVDTLSGLLPDGSSWGQTCERALAHGRTQEFDLDVTGKGKHLRVSIFPFGGDERAVLVTDATEQQRMWREMERLVDERTADLARANEELLEANLTKDRFLAAMSHELRTPLNSIIGFSGILAQGLVGRLSAEQQKQVGMINGAGTHLLALINDILDLSRVRAGGTTVRSSPLDPSQLAGEVLETVRPLADEKGLDVALQADSAPHLIRSDERLLRQILLNLVGNAVKFTESGTVSVTICSPSPDEVAFRVADTGPGIAPGELSALFEPFTQGEPMGDSKPQGTGLGLAISQEYAMLLGGKITVDSQPGRGSTFTLRLPVEHGDTGSDRPGPE